MPAPITEPSFLSEYWGVIVTLVGAGIAWGRLEMGMKNLRKEHRELKQEVDMKTDRSVCEVVHTTQRENQHIVLSTIESGQKAIRRDIATLTSRLDNYINGRGKGNA